MRQALSNRPVLTALAVVTLYFLVLAAPALMSAVAFGSDPSRTPQSAPLGQIPMEIALAASAVAILIFLGWARSGRLTSKPAWGGLWFAVPPALLTLALLFAGISNGLQSGLDLSAVVASGFVTKVILLVVFVGIFEETLFRGIVLHGFERRFGGVVALFASCVLFGSMHYVNWVEGQSFSFTNQQVIHAGLGGLLYGAIALRARSIWPGVFLHALWDFTVMVNGAMGVDAHSTHDAVAAGDGFDLVAFLFRYFEPIFGLIALLSWWRWHNRETVEAEPKRTK